MHDKNNTLAATREALLKLIWWRGHPSHFEALAGRRVWKLRPYDLIGTYYSKIPLQQRQWDKLLDIAAECARTPGTTGIDNEKRGRMIDFLCRAIYRGEFKDGKGRMQVANLHPSPHVPIRLDLKWLEFDQLLAFAEEGYLLIRRKECIECFSHNNIDFPKTWLPSELTGPEVPNTRSLPPTLPARHHDVAEECWKVIEPRSSQRERCRALTIMRRIWPGGPPLSMSIREIADQMARAAKPPSSTNPDTTDVDPNYHQASGFSESTIGRLLKRDRVPNPPNSPNSTKFHQSGDFS
jgi:hypothetical protein